MTSCRAGCSRRGRRGSTATAKFSLLSLSSSSSLTSHLSPLSASPAFLALAVAPRSRFARGVAVSSELEEDEVLSDEGEASFSPDLKLFVGNLPFSVDSAQLAGLFESAGNVEMVEVIYDKDTGRSRGFGFVTTSSVKIVEGAAQQFNGYVSMQLLLLHVLLFGYILIYISVWWNMNGNVCKRDLLSAFDGYVKGSSFAGALRMVQLP